MSTQSERVTLSRDDLLHLYRTMMTIRRFEERARALLARNLIPGFLHLSIGQEAVAAGACFPLRQDDYITSTHRGHGHAIAKGADLRRLMAELFAREDGYSRGLAGSMHLADPAVGNLGANAIVGANLPIGTGAAYATKVQGGDRVTLVFFGDGAANEGVFHESLNIAGLWKLPVIYLCENNLYAEMTAQDIHAAVPQIAERAAVYGMAQDTVDGNDALAVVDAVSHAVMRARAGEGATLVEARTYRWGGHFEGDPAAYRPPGELAEWQVRDPILLLRNHLLSSGVVDGTALKAIDAAVAAEIEAAVSFAQASPELHITEIARDVYV